jgi:hypothetical protein
MEFWTPDSLEICELIEDLKELEFSDRKVRALILAAVLNFLVFNYVRDKLVL